MSTLSDRLHALPFAPPAKPSPAAVPAAVLLALAPSGEDDYDLILVRRPTHLRRHAGQVGLPGGAIEPGDADETAAALREAWEEVGLPPSAVRVLGTLERAYVAASGYDVLPVVGTWDGRAPLVPNPGEVAGILRPTLRQLADPANHGTLPLEAILPPEQAAARSPAHVTSPVFHVDGVVVWGFTAGLLVRFLTLLGLPAPPVPPDWQDRHRLRSPL